MAIQSKSTITNSLVNSGVAINLNTTSIGTSWEAFTDVKNKPRQSIGATYTTSLSEGINTGHGNIVHTISGTYDLTAAHTTGVSAKIDREFLEGIMNNAHITMTLVADKFKTSTNTTGSINVMVTNYSDNSNYDNTISYTLVVKEVKV